MASLNRTVPYPRCDIYGSLARVERPVADSAGELLSDSSMTVDLMAPKKSRKGFLKVVSTFPLGDELQPVPINPGHERNVLVSLLKKIENQRLQIRRRQQRQYNNPFLRRQNSWLRKQDIFKDLVDLF